MLSLFFVFYRSIGNCDSLKFLLNDYFCCNKEDSIDLCFLSVDCFYVKLRFSLFPIFFSRFCPIPEINNQQ